MKKILMVVTLLLCFNSVSSAQEIKFKVVKPLPVVKNSVAFVGKVTGKILHGAKKILQAPFTTPVPKPEMKEYKYTFPRLRWERGKLEEVKPEASKPTGDPHESKAKWRRKIRIEAETLEVPAPEASTPEVLAPRPANSELLDLPRVRPQVTLI